MLEFGILGPLVVRGEGGNVAVPGTRRRALLIRLLVSANQAVAAERLVEEVWDGVPPAGAASTLQSHLSFLRKTLGSDRVTHSASGYALDVAHSELDVRLFEAEFRQGRSALDMGDIETAAQSLETGLARWRGPALADVSMAAWALPEITRLEEMRLVAFEAWHEALLALGRHGEVAATAQAAVSEHPLRERLWGQLMLALYRSGRQADALRAYQRLRTHLSEELGIDPSPELVALEQAILNQAPDLLHPGSTRPRDVGSPSVAASTAPQAWLVRDDLSSAKYELVPGQFSIGRDSANDLSLSDDMQASRCHALLQFRSGQWILEDSASLNGTFINGRRVGSHPLRAGDQVRIGETVFSFLTEDPFSTVTADRFSDRVMATVLLTDIVESTALAHKLRASKWQNLLNQHDSISQQTISLWNGELVKSTGDGVLATFDGAERGVRCALALRNALAGIGLAIRVGIHAGEIERRGDDVSGIGIHIAARVLAAAESQEVLVSRTVRDLLTDSEIDFRSQGQQPIKGLPDQWELFSVA